VKRVVALPGDSLETNGTKAKINGWPIPSCRVGASAFGEVHVEFLGDATYLVLRDDEYFTHAGPLYAAKDAVLVLGDNRRSSADSRFWNQGRDGNVKLSSIFGHPLFVWRRPSPEETERFGIDLTRPILPSSLAHLQPMLDECLAHRPTMTTPPRGVQ
jgi:hypothetical protein